MSHITVLRNDNYMLYTSCFYLTNSEFPLHYKYLTIYTEFNPV